MNLKQKIFSIVMRTLWISYHFASVISLLVFLFIIRIWFHSYWAGEHLGINWGNALGRPPAYEILIVTGKGGAFISICSPDLQRWKKAGATCPSGSHLIDVLPIEFLGPSAGGFDGYPILYSQRLKQTRINPLFASEVRLDYDVYHADYHDFVAPFWAIVLPFAILPPIWLRGTHQGIRNRRRLAKGMCVNCGYDLRETRTRCPECGRPVTVCAKRTASQM